VGYTSTKSIRSGAYACKTGYKPISWAAKGASAAPEVYYGKYMIDRTKTPGKVIQQAATLVAETPVLPAGAYDVRAIAQVEIVGLSGPACFVAVVGAAPSSDGVVNQSQGGTDGELGQIVVDDQLSVKANNRLGLYCVEQTGAPQTHRETYLQGGDLSATLTGSLKGVVLVRH
jgi:hypothetical protein